MALPFPFRQLVRSQGSRLFSQHGTSAPCPPGAGRLSFHARPGPAGVASMALGFLRNKSPLQRVKDRDWTLSEERDEVFRTLEKTEGLSLSQILWMLSDTNSDTRQLGMRLARKLSDSGTAGMLFKEMKGKREQAQKFIAKVIAELPPDQLMVGLKERLLRGDNEERGWVVDILEQMPRITDADMMARLLDDPVPSLRYRALMRLSSGKDRLDSPKLADKLASLCEDPDPRIRLITLKSMSNVDNPTVRKRVVAGFADPDYSVHQEAIRILTPYIQKGDREVEKELMHLLSSESNLVRVGVVRALLHAPDRDRVIRDLIEHSKSLLGWVRDRLLESLKEFGQSLLEPTIALMWDPDPGIRLAALILGSHYEDPRVVDAVTGLLDDEDWWLRLTAIETLGRIGDRRVVPRLIKTLADDTIRWASIEALGLLKDPRATQPILELLKNDQADTRLAALMALEQLGQADILPTLEKLAVEDPIRGVRDRAIELHTKISSRQGLKSKEGELAEKAVHILATSKVTELEKFLVETREKGASDFHLAVGAAPTLRIHGELIALDAPLCTEEGNEKLIREILSPRQLDLLKKNKQLDFCHVVENVGRYRGNIFVQRLGLGAVFRVIPTQVPTIHGIGLPGHLADLVNYKQGLIVVSGSAGCGKSTTLAALVNLINESKRDHILTIEDPVEFVHSMKNSLVNQREVGKHSVSFSKALRAALREDPDCIVVGEMRDSETIRMAMTAAETGHVVIATMNTTSAPKTVDRLIESFPPNEQPQVRMMLSESLKCVITQQLLPRKDGRGRVACFEVLMNTFSVSSMIRDNKTYQLVSAMQIGKSKGIITVDDALMELIRKDLVTPEMAYLRAVKRETFEPLVSPVFLQSTGLEGDEDEKKPQALK